MRRLNRGALAQMRTMLLELRGDRIADVPLQQLLRNLVEAAESRASTHVSLVIDGEPAVVAPRPRGHLPRRAGGPEQHHAARARGRRLGGADAAAGVRPPGRRRRRRRLRPLGHGPQPHRPGLHARARRRDRRPPHGDHGAGARYGELSGRSRGPGGISTSGEGGEARMAGTTRQRPRDRRGWAAPGASRRHLAPARAGSSSASRRATSRAATPSARPGASSETYSEVTGQSTPGMVRYGRRYTRGRCRAVRPGRRRGVYACSICRPEWSDSRSSGRRWGSSSSARWRRPPHGPAPPSRSRTPCGSRPQGPLRRPATTSSSTATPASGSEPAASTSTRRPTRCSASRPAAAASWWTWTATSRGTATSWPCPR